MFYYICRKLFAVSLCVCVLVIVFSDKKVLVIVWWFYSKRPATVLCALIYIISVSQSSSCFGGLATDSGKLLPPLTILSIHELTGSNSTQLPSKALYLPLLPL